MVNCSAWLTAGALTVGLGAAALMCSGLANADTGTGSSARHTVSAHASPHAAARHPPRSAAPAAALIAAVTVNGVAHHKPRPAAAVPSRHTATAGSAPPTAHTGAATDAFTDLLGRIVMLGSDIQHFNVVRAVHTAEAAVTSAVHGAVRSVVDTVRFVVAGIATVIGTAVFVVALPVEIPLAIYFVAAIIQSPLWF